MHVGQLELGVLELAQALAELDTLLRVLDSLVDSALAQAQGLRGDADPAAVQGLHGDLEALALFAQQILLGNDAVGEHDLGGGGAVQAHLLLVLAHGEAGEAALHDEGGDAAGTLGLVGHGEDHEHVGHVAVGDEDLGAVEDIVVAVQLGLGLALGGVGTGVGFGQAEGADLVSTDNWRSCGYDENQAKRQSKSARWQVNETVMKAAKPDALFMHCLPAFRGQEVSSEVIDGPQSVVWDEAENRLHFQKALMEYLLLGRIEDV